MDDVLASIRRIVIEEERAEDEGRPAVPAEPDPHDFYTEETHAEPIPLPAAFLKPAEDAGDAGSAEAPSEEPATEETQPPADIVEPEDIEELDADGEFVLTSSMQAAHPEEPPAAEAPPDLPGAIENILGDDALETVVPQDFETLPDPESGAAPETTTEAMPDAESGEPATLDEEQLAEMVRGMVRDELTGAYGATLSRNIRRLVRDEVRKALSERG